MKSLQMVLCCVLCAGGVWAQNTASSQKGDATKSKGLEIVGGGVPGVILVAGEPAFPLVEGRVRKVRVPVAAATRVGKGRVVAVGHELFLSDEGMKRASNAAFVRSSLVWLAGGVQPKTICYDTRMKLYRDTVKHLGDVRIQAIDRLEQLAGVALPAVFLISPESRGVDEMPKVRAFLERGGGVLCSEVGWGWRQITRKSLKTQSAFRKLRGADRF